MNLFAAKEQITELPLSADIPTESELRIISIEMSYCSIRHIVGKCFLFIFRENVLSHFLIMRFRYCITENILELNALLKFKTAWVTNYHRNQSYCSVLGGA